MKRLATLLLAVCTCLLVGAALTACGDEHEHSYGPELSFDETHHWRACEGEDCDGVADKAEHSFADGECACGYEQADGNGCQHSWEERVEKEPTCTEGGLVVATCKLCGESESRNTDDLGGHSAAVDAAVPKTCTTPGLTEGSHCSTCDEVLVAQTEVPATGHTAVTDAAVPKTCTTPGLTEGSHCLTCDEVLVAQTEVLAGHMYGAWEMTLEPTQTQKGMIKRTCSADVQHKETFELPALSDSSYAIANESEYTSYTYNKDGQSFIVKISVYEFALNTSSDGYILVGYNGNSASLEIPNEYKDLPVVGIAEEAFANNSKLTSVIIPDNVTEIGFKAFYGCSSLKNITVPFVGESANGRGNIHFGYIFGASESGYNDDYVPDTLTEVTLSGESVGAEAFRGLENVKKIVILEGVTSLAHSAFSYCEGLEAITLPSTLKYVGAAFNNCNSLANVYYTGTVEDWCNIEFDSISSESSPFYYADWNLSASHFYMLDNDNSWYEVTEINIPDTVTEIGAYQFYGFNSVTDITVPNSITSIGYLAFKGCLGAYKAYGNAYYLGNEQNPYLVLARYKDTSITECEINENAKFILESAFSNCNHLTSVVIPGSVKSISESAFYYCTALNSVTINEGVTAIGANAFYGCTNLTSIVIPSSVTAIGNNAFYNCSKLDGITFGADITSIGSGAFQRCTGLTSVEIPGSVKRIENSTFSGCTNLASVKLNDGVTAIGANAFYNCTSLTAIAIPESITSIDKDAFNGCTGLSYYEYGNAYYLGNDTNNYVVLVKVKNTTSYSYSIASMTRVIGDHAFSGCTNVSSITIPAGVTHIGNYAFYNCSKLSSLTLQEGLKEIGLFAFSGCSKLKNITIPSSVESIGQSAFSNCTALTTVTISEGVKSIGSLAFQYCTALTSVQIPSSVEYVGWNPFSGCDSLVLNEYGNAYYLGNDDNPYLVLIKCKNNSITSCEINSETKIVATNAFGNAWSGCTQLTNVTISSKSVSICDGAFDGCTALTDVYFTGSQEEWNNIKIGESNDYLVSSVITYDYVAE